MCCHNSPAKKGLLDSISLAAPSLPKGERFWHARGGTPTGSDAEVIDRLWIAATTGDHWDSLNAEQRLAATTEFLEARAALLASPLSDSTRSALDAGTTRLIRKEASAVHRATLKRMTVLGVGGALLLSIGGLVGQSQPNDAHAAALFTAPQATASAIYTMPTAGKCPTGTVKEVVGKAKTITLKVKSGKTVAKTVKRGAVICRFTSANGTTAAATYDASGVLSALPSNFPKNPSAADIASLGLTKTSKVSRFVQVPQPKACAVGKPADRIVPVAVESFEKIPAGTFLPFADGTPGGTTAGDNYAYVTVTWQATGGSGLISMGQSQKDVKLNPNGTTTFTVKQEVTYGAGSSTGGMFPGMAVTDDCGQADLPESMMLGWTQHLNPQVAGNIQTNSSGSDAWFSVRSDGTVVMNASGATAHLR